jgi:hypothetical protein
MSRVQLVRILDWVIVVLVLTTIYIDLTGGFSVHFLTRLSVRREERAVFATLAAILLRLSIGRSIPPLDGRLARFRPIWNRVFVGDADPVPARSPRELRHALFAAAGFVAIGALLMRTQLAHMDSVPDLGDPLFSMWRMGWVVRQLHGDPRPLFDGNIFHPEPLTLTYSDSMLLPAVTGAPLLAMGLHPVVAYNLLFLSGFLLSALTTWLLATRLTGSARAGFVAGLIYGLYPYRFEHYSHLELQMTYWMPLGLLALHAFARTPRIEYAAAAGLCAVAQLYSSMYYGVFFPLYAGAVFLTLACFWRPPARRVLATLATVAAVASVLAVPLARPYLAAQGVKGDRDIPTVTFYSATASDYLRPHPRSALYGHRLLPDIYPERALFPGATPLILTAAALVPPLGATRLAYFVGMVFAFDLSRGFNGSTYEFFYRWFLPIRGMRVPARASAILAISLAVLAGFAALRLLRRCRRERTQAIAFGLLVAAVAYDLHPRLELMAVWPEPPSIYSGIAGDRSVVLAEIPFETKVPGVTNSVQYMYFSLWHWLPMVNGYSGFTTESYRELVKEAADFPSDTSVALLKARGATHVSVNCAFFTEGCQKVLDAVEARGDFCLVSSAKWQGATVNLYRLGCQ